MPPGAHGSGNRHMHTRDTHTCSRGTVEVPQARRGAGFQPSLYEAGGGRGASAGVSDIPASRPWQPRGAPAGLSRVQGSEEWSARPRGQEGAGGPALCGGRPVSTRGRGERKTCAASLPGPHTPPPTRSAHRRPPGAPRARAPDTHPGPDFSSLHPGTHPQGRAPATEAPAQPLPPPAHLCSCV